MIWAWFRDVTGPSRPKISKHAAGRVGKKPLPRRKRRR